MMGNKKNMKNQEMGNRRKKENIMKDMKNKSHDEMRKGKMKEMRERMMKETQDWKMEGMREGKMKKTFGQNGDKSHLNQRSLGKDLIYIIYIRNQVILPSPCGFYRQHPLRCRSFRQTLSPPFCHRW